MLLRTSRLLVDATAQASGPSWVRIKDGSIAELGEGPGEPAVGEEVLDLGDALLMPGLVMAHTHVEFGVFRGHGDGLGFVPWIQGLTRRRMEDFDFPGLLASARLSCLELVAAGVTGVGEATTHGEAAVKALRESGLRGACYLEELGPDPRDVDQVLDRMRMRLDGLEELAAGTRLRIGSPPTPSTRCTPGSSRRCSPRPTRARSGCRCTSPRPGPRTPSSGTERGSSPRTTGPARFP